LNIDQNAKTKKGQKKRYMTGILYLAPADSSGYQVCVMAGFCKGPCLNTAGRGQFAKTQQVRIAKTRLLFENREFFLACLRYDIHKLIRLARRKHFKPCVRINGTSDLAWLAMLLAAEFPQIQFYDYTKLPKPELRFRPNYHLTFSHDGNAENVAECFRVLEIGVNVSVVFSTKRGRPLPETWHSYPVIDGDETDLRFLDPHETRGVIVGLRAKGRARKACAPFVQPAAAPLIQIAAA
jgi:hypothetical protein